MKALRALSWVAVLCAIVGCSRQGSEHTAAEPAVLQLFEKGKGLRLPDNMARTLGVETIEVVEKSFRQEVDAAARVYQSGRGSTPGRATALLDHSETVPLLAGQTVTLRCSGTESQAIVGRLVRLDSQTAAFGKAEALIEFPDAEGRHAAGASLVATFPSAAEKVSFAVPASAVLRDATTSFVYTINGSHFVRTPVKPGAQSEGWVEIADGLYAGDDVVARGGDALWRIELCALKGGAPCCPAGKKPGRTGD